MERWLYIPGYEGTYAVSDQGRVYSYFSSRRLKPGRMPSGHMSVCLGWSNSRCVHELVLLAFVGPCPDKHEARHRNDIPNDNTLANLSWATRSRNGQDKKWNKGAKTYKLTPGDAHALRIERAGGAAVRDLAVKYGVCRTTIRNVVARRTHADVN